MTFRNKSINVGDLVESVFANNKTKVMGVVVDLPEEWSGRKIKVLWNTEIGVRLEWLNDIRKVKVE